jgi:ABC-type glycerol-3-phosphate transport system permease component
MSDTTLRAGYYGGVKRRKRNAAILCFVLLSLGSLLFLVPFFWMVSTSLKPQSEIFAYPVIWIPSEFHFENYSKALTVLPFGQYFLNTFFIAFMRIAGQVVACSIVAFSFARLRFPGRNVLFMTMLSTLMLPGIVTMIPSFVMFTKIGWVNTWLPLIVPMLFATPFNTFLLRQYYMTLPRDLDEAAKLDGCTTWGIFGRVLLPLTIPAVTAIVVFEFMNGWNDFMGPLLYLRDKELFTVSLGLAAFRSKIKTEWALLMAASAVAMVPSLILFAVAQKYIIGGIALTGIKG